MNRRNLTPGASRRDFRSSEIGNLEIAKQGYLFVGGAYFDAADGEFMSGQMYVEYQVPAHEAHSFPIVMFAGGSQSGINYTGAPDGRDGWAQFFLSRGFSVFVTDQPARGRSAYHPDAAGPVRRTNLQGIEGRFSAPARNALWPQAKLHTQWPGAGVKGDPVFDQFMAQELPSLASLARQQQMNQHAGAALLDEIGPAILMTHSQAGPFGWLIADARPDRVAAIVAIEPNGPPVRELVPTGRADHPFEDGEMLRPHGITTAPLAYDPPLESASDLRFVRCESREGSEISHGWLQADPARTLPNLKEIPVLVLQGEASYHAPYDCWTADYLRQAGVNAHFIRLADLGIRGNAHMMMLEKNNLQIADVIAQWLAEIGL